MEEILWFFPPFFIYATMTLSFFARWKIAINIYHLWLLGAKFDHSILKIEKMTKKNYHPDPAFGYVDVDGAVRLLGISKSKLYKMTADRKLFFYKPSGKLYFKISELQQWIETDLKKLNP